LLNNFGFAWPECTLVLAPAKLAMLARYDPSVMQFKAAQEALTGPPDPAILQCPRTASSGRRLIVVNWGAS